jgi:Ca2+-binding RTX toxin-like protein
MRINHKAIALLLLAFTVGSVHAASQQGGDTADVLIGKDNDNTANAVIQPNSPPPNQSLNNADIIEGNSGNDVLIGLLGNDVLLCGAGDDVAIGGTEQFDDTAVNGGGPFGNKDVIDGGSGNDTNIWAPGDGSDAFNGGEGDKDAQVFGVVDRDANNVPIVKDAGGVYDRLPTADVTGSPGFCRLERLSAENSEALGFDFLVRFFVRATGNLAVTIRLKDTEQVFCTSEAGGEITYANLLDTNPAFIVIPLTDVNGLNPTVAQIIR